MLVIRTSKDIKFQILNCVHYVQRNRPSYMFLLTVYKHSIDIRGDNSIIQTFRNHPLKNESYDFRLYADTKGFENPATLFKLRQQSFITTESQQNDLLHRERPDIANEIKDKLTVIELTCPYNTNTAKSRECKETIHKEIKSELLAPPSNFQLIFLEVTSLGFVTRNIKTFLKSININERYVIEKLQEVAIRCSYLIYCRRNKNWNEPNLISYE